MRRRHRSWSSFSDATIDYILARMPAPLRPERRSPAQRLGSGLVAVSVLSISVLLLACPLWLLLYGLGNAGILDGLASWGFGFAWLLGLGLFLLGKGPQPKWRIILGLVLVGAPLLFGAHLLGGGDRFFQAVFCLFWGTAFWAHADGLRQGSFDNPAARSRWGRPRDLAATTLAYLLTLLLSLPAPLVDATPWLAEVATWRPATFFWLAYALLMQSPSQQAPQTTETPAHRAALRVTQERDERDWNDR